MASKRAPAWSAQTLVLLLVVAVVSAGIGAAVARRWQAAPPEVAERLRSGGDPTAAVPTATPTALRSEAADEAAADDVIAFPQELWKPAGLETGKATMAPLQSTIRLTGKVALDEDHVAHVFPLVQGRVDQVHVRFGQQVKRGDLLVTVQSREVGEAQLALQQDRLLLESARQKDQWTQEIAQNARHLVDALNEELSIEEIEQQFRDRPIGEYREQLLSAYVALLKSETDLQRLSSLTDQQAVAAKSVRAAQAQYDADRARLQALLEQAEHDARRSTLVSSQAVKEAQTRVMIAEAGLQILGCREQRLTDLPSHADAAALSQYPVIAPFDGTVITKDVVLLERVDPSIELLRIADLSSVWIATDIYEEQLSLLHELPGQTIYFHSAAWPERRFQAEVFYTGEIVDPATRTIAMRAVADNAEGLLKPGMFVNVEIPRADPTSVLQVPADAIQDHQGKTFVFVSAGEGSFERREVTVGRTADQSVEIVDGLTAGESVVVAGGFALKSKMLESLMAGD